MRAIDSTTYAREGEERAGTGMSDYACNHGDEMRMPGGHGVGRVGTGGAGGHAHLLERAQLLAHQGESLLEVCILVGKCCQRRLVLLPHRAHLVAHHAQMVMPIVPVVRGAPLRGIARIDHWAQDV